MGKHNNGTRFIYRKSNSTLNTRSKTCSGASQFLTRSGILQLKKGLPKNSYYVENGKIKRDLSIETDICILRGYYKKKFARFRRSINTTEIGTVEELKHDHNSCGDSIPEDHNEKTRLNIDVTSLVIENLKDLLNDWIKKYLLNNDDTKQKIETVLDSILHKLEVQQNSSSYTYTLDIKVDEKKKLNSNKNNTPKFVTCGKRSCRTVPVTGKHIKLISTLSIPRNIERHISHKSQYSKQGTRKVRYKNVFLTISRSSTFLLNFPSFDLLSMSTKSFIKRCGTYNSKEIKNDKREAVFLPKSSYTESVSDILYHKKNEIGVESKVHPNALEVEPVRSLLKSIYADDPANITSTDKNITKCKHDNYTMTETNWTHKYATCPNELNWKKAKYFVKPEYIKVENKRKKNTRSKTLSHVLKIRKTKSKKKHLHSVNCLSKINTDTTNLRRKSKSKQKDNNFLQELQGVFKQFTNYTDSSNIKFDVRINVFPELRDKTHDEPHNIVNRDNPLQENIFTASKITENQSICTKLSQKSQPKLISILDGAVSQSKYVISKEGPYNSTNKYDNTDKIDNVITEPDNIPTGLQIAKDISELRVIIRDLAITTEKFVKEHLKSKPRELEVKDKIHKINNNISRHNLKSSTISKAIQYSSNKSQIISGLKLKKEPKKKDIQGNYTRLDKKSISYNIIESESILKVTDMTTGAAELSTDKLINKTFNCTLPKSKSLFEITVGQSKRKLLAYYCDELIKSRQFVQNRNKCCSSNTYNYTTCPHAENDYSQFVNDKTNHENNEIACGGIQQCEPFQEDCCEICAPDDSCSSVYIDVEDRKKFAVRSRSGMSFWEGLLYCILLWIPVIIIFWLIYVYVIRDIIQPANPAIGRTMSPSQRLNNNSMFHITLSDLGF